MSETKTDELRPAKKLEVGAEDLRRWEDQPRKHFDPEKHKNLVASVKLHGVMQNLIVRYTDEEECMKSFVVNAVGGLPRMLGSILFP